MFKSGIGAIIHMRWIKGDKPGEIIGFWAEDLNHYSIIMPPQLVDIMISTQNWLSDKYDNMNNLISKTRELEYFFKNKEKNND